MKKYSMAILMVVFCFCLIPMTAAADELGFEVIKSHPGDVECILAEDLDQDGYTDILYSGIIEETYILYGTAAGTFESPEFFLPVYQGVLTTGYLDSDTLLDIIVAYNAVAYVMFNNGFRDYTQLILNVGNVNLGGVSVGYFNDDIHADLIIAPNHIFLGDGQRGFPQNLQFPYGSFETVYVSDFNNDGIDDIITIANWGNTNIYVNDGNANFTYTDGIHMGGLTLSLSSYYPVADFNRDKNADFAFVTPHVGPVTNSMITVGYGDGTGHIADIDTIRVHGTSYSLAITDANRDKNLDLAVSDATNHQLIIHFGEKHGQFGELLSIDYQTDSVMHAMATCDINRDGNPDFVAGAFWNDSIAIIQNTLDAQPVLEDRMITTGYSNVNLEISNPDGHTISQNYQTVAGARYRRLDYNQDSKLDEQAVDYNLQYGEYKITIKKKYNADPDARFTSTIKIGDEEFIFFKDYTAPPLIAKKSGGLESDSIEFFYTVEPVSSITPANGQKVDDDYVTFDWSRLIGQIPSAPEYYFQLSPYYDFSSSVYSTVVPGTDLTLSETLTGDRVYYWRIAVDNGSSGEFEYSNPFAVYIAPKPTDVENNKNQLLPDQFELGQNFPNPFNPATNIDYYIPTKTHVELSVYNLLGQKVKTLENAVKTAGNHTAIWDGTDQDNISVAGGIYLYQLKVDEFNQTRKMLLLK